MRADGPVRRRQLATVIALWRPEIVADFRCLTGASVDVMTITRALLAPVPRLVSEREASVATRGGVFRLGSAAVVILDAVAEATRTTPGQIVGPSRELRVTRARHLAMYLAYVLTDGTLRQIAQAFGRSDHSTVLNARDGVESRLAEPKTGVRFRKLVDELAGAIDARAGAYVALQEASGGSRAAGVGGSRFRARVDALAATIRARSEATASDVAETDDGTTAPGMRRAS